MSDHYFSAEPTSASHPRTLDVRLAGYSVQVSTDAGVFSPTRLDQGTAVLLDALPMPPAGELLDLGCGWGPISLHAALRAREAGIDLRVWALDVNERSLGLTEANARALGLSEVNAVTADLIPAELRFQTIWSNPPIRVGKDVLHGLLQTWLPRLVPGGEAWLVVAKKLGADSLRSWIQDSFPGYRVEKRSQSKGFHVIVVVRG